MTVRFDSRFFASKSRFCFDFCIQGALKGLLYGKIRIQDSLKYVALTDEQRRLQFVRHLELHVKNAVLLPPLENLHKANRVRQALCHILINGDERQGTLNPPVPVNILKLRV